MFKLATISAVAALSLAVAWSAAAGEVTVVDGDTLVVHGTPYRLSGIDAPELGQPCRWPAKTIDCGAISRTAVLDMVSGAEVACRPIAGSKPDEGEGRQAICTANGFDVGENMLHTGWAVTLPQASDHYNKIMTAARDAKRGLWRGEFTNPWEWRALAKADPGNGG